MSAKDVCQRCWHEGCRGNCETPAQRAARERAAQVKAVADRRKREEGRRK